jgi:hypothetical protein
LRLAIVFCLVASCRQEAVATKPADRETPASAAPAPVDLPRVRVLNDIAEHHGKRVVVEGLYEVEPIARGKGGNRVWLVLSDGTRISRAYDVVKSELAYASRRVLATGKITSGPPDTHVQAMSGPHLVLDKLDLAPAEAPLGPTPTDIPAPAVASAAPSLAVQIDRWVQIVGTLSSISGDTANVKLADGTVVRVEKLPPITATPPIGKTVTAIGRLDVDKAASTFALSLVLRPPNQLCPGAVARCGM